MRFAGVDTVTESFVGGRLRRLATLPNYPSHHRTRTVTQHNYDNKESAVSLGTILLIILVLALVGAIPAWPHSRSWGYGPSGGLGLVVIVLIVLLLMGRI